MTEIQVNESVVPALVGVNNSNLKLFQLHLGVNISNIGGLFRITGNNSTLAKEILESMATIAAKRELVQEDVANAINLALRQHTETIAQTVGNIVHIGGRAKDLRFKNANQAKYFHAMKTHDLNFAIGTAGTGKTFLAIAAGLHHLLNKNVERLILTRPAVEAGEALGFLPGDIEEKITPYLQPMYDALNILLNANHLNKLLETQTIEIAPLAFMRGRTLNNSFIVLDEAQNTTVAQMKMFLTRLGQGSKMVITGDLTQADLPKHQTNGLRNATEILNKIDGVHFTKFTNEDVVRHRLIQDIVEAYDKHEHEHEHKHEQSKTNRQPPTR